MDGYLAMLANNSYKIKSIYTIYLIEILRRCLKASDISTNKLFLCLKNILKFRLIVYIELEL